MSVNVVEKQKSVVKMTMFSFENCSNCGNSMHCDCIGFEIGTDLIKHIIGRSSKEVVLLYSLNQGFNFFRYVGHFQAMACGIVVLYLYSFSNVPLIS